MKKIRKTFRFKLYSIFIISMIVPSIIIAIIFSIFYNRTLFVQEEKNIEYVLKSISNSMEIQFTELKNIGDTYYMQKEVFQEVEALNSPELYENYDDLVMRELENNYSISIIKMLYMSKQEICDVVFFPINTENQIGYYVGKNHSGIEVIDAKDYEKEEWFLQALEVEGRPVFYANHIPEYRRGKNKEEVYSCVRAIRSMDSKKVIGVIKIDADVKNLEKVVNVIDSDTEDNIIISDGIKVLAKTKENLEIGSLENLNGIQRVDNRLYYMKSIEIPDTDWKLTYLFSIQTVLGGYIVGMLITFTVTVIVVLLAFLIYKRYAKETVDDMEHITEVFREIQTGNLEVQAEVKSGNELHDIAVAINKMICNLKEYIDKEYIWVIRQQKAEYKALQAQINPHFLYNTLNGFVALNRMGEKKKLEKSIISLAYLFRYICNKNDETTIESEFTFLTEYLELEKLKYEERLDYIISIDEKCKNKKIPKLLLQPIVENCIVHGMGDDDTPIIITVTAETVMEKGIENITEITIRDNGVGFDENDFRDRKEHIGIDNVKVRAELYFSDVIYQCKSTPGKGTETTFVFKDEQGEE